MKKHGEPRDLICPHCHKRFETTEALQNHQRARRHETFVPVPEPLCPFGDGRHKRKPWHDARTGHSGLACEQCSKTWYYVDTDLVPTYDFLAARARVTHKGTFI